MKNGSGISLGIPKYSVIYIKFDPHARSLKNNVKNFIDFQCLAEVLVKNVSLKVGGGR